MPLRFAIATLLSLLAPASVLAQSTPAPSPELTAVVWQLTAIEGGASPVTVDNPANSTVQFRPDGTVAVRLDCNMGSGGYTVVGDRLTIGPIATTLMGCPGDQRLAAEFGMALGTAERWSYEADGSLRITTSDSRDLLFRASLAGVVWQWQQFEGSDGGVVAAPDPERYTVVFLTDGSLQVQADCNRGRGRWTADGSGITVGPVATTRMACPPGSQDQLFLRTLNEAASCVFRDGLLHLALRVDSGIATFAPAVPAEPATPAP